MSELSDLVARLVEIDSVNPELVPGAAGEQRIAELVAGWMDRAGLEVVVQDVAPGRPNVIGRVAGLHPGPCVLLLGHTDTVGTAGMNAAVEPRIDGSRLYGRGAYDMKSGLAAALCAAAELKDVAGEVIVAAVCDEEAGGLGTRAFLTTSSRVDAAIVTEPTDLGVAIAHKGFTAFEIETTGRAAHGSMPAVGEDAILAMGPILVALAQLDDELQRRAPHKLLGTPSLHASLIEGGQEFSSYPERCVVIGEWRTLPGDDPSGELDAMLRASGANAKLRIGYQGDPFEVAADAAVVQTLLRHARTELTGVPFWADSALLAAAGIPTVLFGPAGSGAHATVEWVDLASVHRVRDVLVSAVRDLCASG